LVFIFISNKKENKENMANKKENTQKAIQSKQKEILNNKQNKQKTISQIIALTLTIFGIILLFSFLQQHTQIDT
jgi:uncharacterized membrane protein